MMAHRGATRLQTSQQQLPRDRDWESFFNLLANDADEFCLDSIIEHLWKPKATPIPTHTIAASPQPPSLSKLRTQKASTLSEYIRHTRHSMRQLIVDIGAQVTTMPESAVSHIPSACNHRDAPPGTAVKYGNGEIETIERLVDIGHYKSPSHPGQL
jgi:hypothetical protein